MGAQINWIWQNSFRPDDWFNWLASGKIKVFCLFTQYPSNKSDKHFLPFEESFHGLEVHIHFDFNFEKYILIIIFTPGTINEFHEEQMKKQSELKPFFFLDQFKAFLRLTF